MFATRTVVPRSVGGIATQPASRHNTARLFAAPLSEKPEDLALAVALPMLCSVRAV